MDVGNPQTKQPVPKTLKMDSSCIKEEKKKNQSFFVKRIACAEKSISSQKEERQKIKGRGNRMFWGCI